MPRRVQDIVPADRRSIRDIPISRLSQDQDSGITKRSTGSDVRPATRKKSASTSEDDRPMSVRRSDEVSRGAAREPIRRMPVTPPDQFERPRKRRLVWPIVTLGIVVIIAVAGYVASAYFSKATFTIVPKSLPVSVNSTYVAQLSTNSSGGLIYDIITLRDVASSSVSATDGAPVSVKASGKVTLYNAYSSQAQRLIAGTRLADASHRIYRLTNSIVIPGYTKPTSGIVPGSITTTVVADAAGADYNISAADAISDLKIVAYENTAKYDTIYARLATDLSGGFTGVKKNVDATVLTSTTALLKSRLTTSLIAKAQSEVPADYIMFENVFAPSFSAATIGSGEKGSAQISEQATISFFIFKKDNLIKTLTNNQAVTMFSPFSYTAKGLESLQVSVTNLKDFSLSKKTPLVVKVKGDLKVIATVPIDEIRLKVAGISLSETQNIFKNYSSVIESGTGELVPPWTRVPSDQSRITVNVKE